MKQPELSFLDWVARFSTEAAYLDAIAEQRWSNGFLGPHCGHDRAYKSEPGPYAPVRPLPSQVLPTAGTVFHRSYGPLTEWPLYLMAATKAGFFGLAAD